jgi:thiol:disulfide interchange protein DsbG
MRRTILLAPLMTAALLLSACDDSKTAPSAPSAPAAAPAEAPVVAPGSFELLDQAKGFQVGKGAGGIKLPTAYILFDPQCSHCAQLWQNAKPLQADVLVKWIPVGVLNRNSVIQAAMLLEATDPVAMMAKNEDAFTATHRPSKVTTEVKLETIRLIEANTELLDKLKVQSVPTIVYRDRLNQAPVVTTGALPTETLADLFGASKRAALAN